jgi:hypothetical protein
VSVLKRRIIAGILVLFLGFTACGIGETQSVAQVSGTVTAAVTALSITSETSVTTAATKPDNSPETDEILLPEKYVPAVFSVNTDITDKFTNMNVLIKIRRSAGLADNAPIMSDDAAAVTKLDVSKCNLTELDGLEYLTGLRILICKNNNLESLPPLPDSLVYLDCSDNEITKLPYLPDSLIELDCSNNKLKTLPNTPLSLEIFRCNDNALSELPALSDRLIFVFCNNNKLTSLPELPSGLKVLNCSENKITALPFLPDSLTSIYYNDNLIKEAPTLPANIRNIGYEHNPITVNNLYFRAAVPFPNVDGSTSTIAMDALIRSKLLGIDYADAYADTKHSKTFEAFENLVIGRKDVVLSVPLAKEQEVYAAEHGFEYEAVPVAVEGFVFMVNPANPVQSLTSEQIRQIYSGEITIWKELGGNDAPIKAYQRNSNSGSQTYMTEFMGETPLADPPRTMVQLDMSGVISMFADYDNSVDAIGYSVYSYAAAFAASEGTFSFVAVDGIKPSRSSFFDGSYPLLSKTYAFYKKGTTDKVVLDYIDYITSDEGQQTILEAGYIPVSGIEIPAAYTLYEAKGTGETAPENPDDKRYYYLDFDYESRPRGFLKDAEFEAEIQAWIDKAIDNYFTEPKPDWESTTDVTYYAEIINGYLGISVGLYTTAGVGSFEEFYGSSAVFDLYKKKKVENLSDLFYKDVDFLPGINSTISAEIMNKTYGAPQKEFFGLCNGFSFDLDTINFQPENAYVELPASFYVTLDMREGCVVSECRDFTELLTPEFAEKIVYIENTKSTSPIGVYYEKNGHVYEYFDYPDVENDRELPENKALEEMFDAYYERGGTEFWAPSPSVNGVFVELVTGFEGPAEIYCSLQHKFIHLEDFFKEGFIEHLTIAPGENNTYNLTAEQIYNNEYLEYTISGLYAMNQIATQITEGGMTEYIEITGGYNNTPILRIDKTWLKDIYQNLPTE